MPACPPRRSTLRSTVAAMGAFVALSGCTTGSPFLDPLGRANEDMQGVVTTYQRLGARPVSELTVAQARTQPTMDDAVRQVMANQSGRAAALPSLERDVLVDGATGKLPARLYDASPGRLGEPIILYFHGGGFVTGSERSDDLTARALASMAHAKVLSVGYRLAPEARFPAQQNDAVAAYYWLLANAGSLGADPRRIAVAGQDAGGNLALNVAVAARDTGARAPVHLLLVDPTTGTDMLTPSYTADKYAVPLSQADMRWYFANSFASSRDGADPRINIVNNLDLRGLPPITVIDSEMSPLESDGLFLTQKLQAQKNDVSGRLYGGTTAGFFGTGAVVARAKQAEEYAAAELDVTFDKIGPPPGLARAQPVAGHRRTPYVSPRSMPRHGS